ncbi:FG-GAP repeat domain-containing protein [Nonomuraea gerenzanensis]|uniref:FG-GAP repeat domain-containing protein n=1 Tax=Nonomuraea gerenzanensis TaxID=93944 RepID=UPI001CD932F2|nr:VCBS repeat-containing protein [Nonomuraea gerenzanensis]
MGRAGLRRRRRGRRLFSTATGTLTVWNGRGGNTFGPATELGPGWEPYAASLMSVGDVNGDGYADLAARQGDTLYVWNGRGANRFGPGTAVGSGWSAYF